MKAEKSLGLAGCKLAAGSEVGITQTPAGSFSSLKSVPKQTFYHTLIQQVTDQLTSQSRPHSIREECKSEKSTDGSLKLTV